MARFEDLDVWRRSSRLCVQIYQGLAKGFERGGDKDSNKFFYYAKSSSGELRTQIYIGIEIGYISKILHALIKSRPA
ncbi:MAG: four helix bundle protein [Methylobacter sp.]|uniref:Four helix bundle protein n=1 Tax=Candidatus Methylobacter titanis TaxID=3053457 RepID=A0AA43Q4A7_9GAMM|nr:four helix bundle protein [Candidatus Methylobacter titanis]MDI1293029.1 four helix bundle protein [Candidatus Methylobacter titanis]